MDWITWSNNNQGFVTAMLTLALVLLTLIYVLTTVIIAWLNLKTTKISERSLDLFAESEKNRIRPYVVFNIFTENQAAYATLKNYGLTVATDIKVVVNPKLTRVFVEEDDESAITDQATSFLPPDYEIKDSLGSSPDFYRNYPNTIFNCEIFFKDTQGNEFKEIFSISLNSMKKRLYKREKSITESLEKMTDEMKQIKESVSSLVENNEN